MMTNRRRRATLAACMSMSVAAALAACGTAGGSDGGEGGLSNDIVFASLDQGSGWYNYAVSMAQVIEPELGESAVVEVLTYAGSMGNPELVATGQADIATSFSSVNSWAVNGTAGTPFEEEAFDNVRVLVGGLDEYYFGPIAASGSGLESMRDIPDEQLGIDLVSQPRASLGDVGTQIILEAYGAPVSDIESWGGSFEPTSTDVASNSIRDNTADLWIQAINAGHPNVTELAETSDITILPIDDDVIAELSDLGLTAATLPAGTFSGQDEDVQLIGFTTTIIASAEMSDETAYAITAALVENAESLRSANASMASFDPETAWTDEATGGIELHPGAQQYFEENGYMDSSSDDE